MTVSQDEINWAIENSIHTAICDYNTAILNAKYEGMTKGIAEGERQNAISNAKNFLIETDLSPEKIAKCCSLPLDQVLALKDELKSES